MMRTVFPAMLLDGYRDLNSRKMFWIVLMLSLLAVGAFAMLGTEGNSLTLLGWSLSTEAGEAPKLAYKLIFTKLVVGVYLTWVAAILALISVASIFPEMLTGGSIDLYLSKPIGRTRLFLMKYFSGLLFVALQVTVFAVAAFIVLGVRGHMWEPSLFLAIPIVVTFFSYIYCICVLLGMLTRSTVAALLLTLLAWFLIWGLDATDYYLTTTVAQYPERQRNAVVQLEELKGAGNDQNAQWQRIVYQQQADEPPPPAWAIQMQKIVVMVKTLVPKTRETVALLDRYLLPDWQFEKAINSAASGARASSLDQVRLDPTRQRSAWWIVGSSLGFEAVMVALAAWRFKRRDF